MYFIIRNHDYYRHDRHDFPAIFGVGYNGRACDDRGLERSSHDPFPRDPHQTIHRGAFGGQPTTRTDAGFARLIKGAFYDSDCLQAAWDLVKGWSWDERMQVYLDSHRDALAARIRRYSLLDLAKELFQIAWEGLRRQRSLNSQGDDETIYLNSLKTLLFQGKCPADVLLEKWEGELQQDIKKLIAYSAYKLP